MKCYMSGLTRAMCASEARVYYARAPRIVLSELSNRSEFAYDQRFRGEPPLAEALHYLSTGRFAPSEAAIRSALEHAPE